MTPALRRATACLAASVALALAGCGQKGPLYLPEKGGAVVTSPSGSAAPAPPPAPSAPGQPQEPAPTAEPQSTPEPAPTAPSAPPKKSDEDQDSQSPR